MSITFTFRQMEPSEAIKKYVTKRISRLQKLLLQPMTANVIISVQKRLHVAEVQLSSGRNHSAAKESSEEMYASIDKVVDKLERQLTASKSETVTKKRRSKATVRIPAEVRDEDETPSVRPRAAAKKKAPAKTTAAAVRGPGAKKKVAKKAVSA